MNSKSIGQEIKILHAMIHRSFSKIRPDADAEWLKGTNLWIIGYLADHSEQDVFQKDLEQEFGITRSAASKAVNTLVDAGYVQRVPVPADARLKKLILTEKSHILCRKMGADFQLMDRTLREGFSQEEVEQLLSYLHRLQDNVSNFQFKLNR